MLSHIRTERRLLAYILAALLAFLPVVAISSTALEGGARHPAGEQPPGACNPVEREWLGDGSAVRLLVSDDGTGVQPGDRDRLFEPFFTSRREEGGSGLGLPIARSLLEACGGAIERVDSDRGATFALTLPRAPTDGARR